MRAASAALLAAAVVALALPPALGQGHAHEAGEAYVVIAHDAAPDGRAVVGNLAHFAAVVFDAEGKPAFHHNVEIAVELNGVRLFATTPESGHDYDGVNAFDLVFPAAGPYRVTATAPGEEGVLTAEFTGVVVEPARPAQAVLVLDLPDTAVANELVPITLQVQDEAGALLPHTDAVVEVVRASDRAVVFRVHTHTHEAPMQLEYAFPGAGDYDVRVVGYTAFPTRDTTDFPAVATTKAVRVQPGSPLPGGLPTLAPPNPERNDVAEGDGGDGYRLLGAYDPYTLVGPYSQTRLSTLVVGEETGEPVQHVNFEATLTDSFGRIVFRSASLHEYDGILEVLAGGQEVGQYTLEVAASLRDWTGSVTQTYTVAPPATPLSAGPQFVQVEGLEEARAGEPAEAVLFVHDAAGRPFAHGEVDVQVVPPGEGKAPVLMTKLHTHGDGRFPFTLALPEPGTYLLRLAPFALEPRPTPLFFGRGVGEAPDFVFEVAEGAGFPPAPPPSVAAGGESVPAAIPGPEAAALLVAVAAAGVALRARRR